MTTQPQKKETTVMADQDNPEKKVEDLEPEKDAKERAEGGAASPDIGGGGAQVERDRAEQQPVH